MPPDQFLTELTGGASLGGMFWPAGATEHAPGILVWDPTEGARVGLIGTQDPGHDWPRDLGGQPVAFHANLHGRLLTLLGAWVSGMNFNGIPSELFSPTIILGNHCTEHTEWAAITVTTANLSEWRAETGLRPTYPRSRGARYQAHLRWEQPEAENVRLPDADLTFVAAMDSTGVSVEPDWSIKTWQQVLVKPDTTMKLDELSARYAEPLVAFTSFVSDRPDSITSEVLRTEAGQRVSVLQSLRIRCLSAALEAGPPIPVSHRGPDEPSGGDQPVV